MPRKKQPDENFPYSPTVPIEFEQVYAIINHIQHNKEECVFMALTSDSLIIENILKDSQIEFQKVTLRKGIRYTLRPPPEQRLSDEMFVFEEEMPDEEIEDGQCF